MTGARRPTPLLALLLALAACGGGDGAGAAPPVAAPPSGGDVWEADHAEDRAIAPATMVAFVNGVHALVVDGDETYAGMTRLRAAKGADGARTVPLANGLTATLAPVGEVMELRFSSGETLPMRRQPARAPR